MDAVFKYFLDTIKTIILEPILKKEENKYVMSKFIYR